MCYSQRAVEQLNTIVSFPRLPWLRQKGSLVLLRAWAGGWILPGSPPLAGPMILQALSHIRILQPDMQFCVQYMYTYMYM